jgi:hypothetical protein
MGHSLLFTRGADVITQQVSDETVLFNMETGHYYSLNELGSRVWELLDGIRTLPEITEILASEYEAPSSVILADVQDLVGSLLGKRLVVNVGSGPALAG